MTIYLVEFGEIEIKGYRVSGTLDGKDKRTAIMGLNSQLTPCYLKA
jgi:hypothetical protein